eukprot:316935-Chlamydomonas_euryale.AAC.1
MTAPSREPAGLGTPIRKGVGRWRRGGREGRERRAWPFGSKMARRHGHSGSLVEAGPTISPPPHSSCSCSHTGSL